MDPWEDRLPLCPLSLLAWLSTYLGGCLLSPPAGALRNTHTATIWAPCTRSMSQQLSVPIRTPPSHAIRLVMHIHLPFRCAGVCRAPGHGPHQHIHLPFHCAGVCRAPGHGPHQHLEDTAGVGAAAVLPRHGPDPAHTLPGRPGGHQGAPGTSRPGSVSDCRSVGHQGAPGTWWGCPEGIMRGVRRGGTGRPQGAFQPPMRHDAGIMLLIAWAGPGRGGSHGPAQCSLGRIDLSPIAGWPPFPSPFHRALGPSAAHVVCAADLPSP